MNKGNILQKIKAQLDKLFIKLYLGNASVIITICWVVASLHLTLFYKYENCIRTYDSKDTFLYFFWLALLVIIIIFLIIISYFIKNKEKIGKEKLSAIEDSEGRNFGFSRTNPKVFIIPLYLFGIFSLSKLIVIFYNDLWKDFNVDTSFLIKVSVLLIIFLFSFWAWLKFQETSERTYSFLATLFAMSYIGINIYWEYFLPFLQSYIKTWHCIFKSLI